MWLWCWLQDLQDSNQQLSTNPAPACVYPVNAFVLFPILVSTTMGGSPKGLNPQRLNRSHNIKLPATCTVSAFVVQRNGLRNRIRGWGWLASS